MSKNRIKFRSVFRIGFIITVILGLLAVSVTMVQHAFAQATATSIPSDTPYHFDFSNPVGLQLTLQFRIIQFTQAVNSSLCGQLVIIHEKKSSKEYLGLKPCTKGGGPYIFVIRPREMLGAYQFVNAKIKTGKKINTEEFGVVNKYLSSFESYYPLEQCSKCGFVSKPVVPPEFLPQSTGQAGELAQVTGQAVVGSGEGSSQIQPLFIFPTPRFLTMDTPTPVPTSSSTLEQPVETSKPTNAPVSNATGLPAPEVILEPVTAVNPTLPAPVNEEPPFNISQKSVVSYSLYTLILVPLMVAGILWRRSRKR